MNQLQESVDCPNTAFEAKPHQGQTRLMEAVLGVSIKEVESVPVVELIGEVDIATTERLQATVLELVNDGARHIIINLDHVKYLDSTGLGTLVGLKRAVEGRDGKLCLALRKGFAERILRLTGLTCFFTIAPNNREALHCLRSEAAAV